MTSFALNVLMESLLAAEITHRGFNKYLVGFTSVSCTVCGGTNETVSTVPIAQRGKHRNTLSEIRSLVQER